MDFFHTYQYFSINIVGTSVVLMAYSLARNHRKMMLTSGLSLVPFSLLAPYHQGEYWNPLRIGGLSFGIEDVLFCFSAGSLTWFLSVWTLDSRVQGDNDLWRFIQRLAGMTIAGSVAFFLLQTYGVNAIMNTIISQLLLLTALLLLRRNLWFQVLKASILYTVYYCSILYAFAFVSPGFFSLWNGFDLLGHRLAGLPIEEIVWVFTFAGCWVAMMGFAADIRLVKKDKSDLVCH